LISDDLHSVQQLTTSKIPVPYQEIAMPVRATLFSLPAFAALVMVCGCSSESPYNIPTDPAKEAAELGPAVPVRKVGGGRRKVTKPPGGGALKDSKNVGTVD
jgi:hypothetical protein